MKKYLYILISLVLVACNDDDLTLLTQLQQDLLGTAVNFSATHTDEFKSQSRTTYNDTGVFNENDLMRIFRQYDDGKGGWNEEAYRTYYFNTKYATGTQISLGTDWKVYAGRKGMNPDSTIVNPQTDADSITWEDGRTVRFRSWTRSNFAGALASCYKNYGANGITNYYPDFCISDWVTVSGPTEQIPLSMRHICSRIAISYRDNYANQFYKVELSTDVNDYMRADNADTNDNDESSSEHGKTLAQAQAELDQVLAAYNRMCMPAGVDIEKSELYAMTHSFWDNLSNNSTDNNKLRFLEDEDPSQFYHYGTKDAEHIRDSVQRPTFGNVNTSCYLVTIPYDMSNGSTMGDVITLPACTRFRVYMHDVNNGDGYNTPGYEGTYHIFSLSDIQDGSGNPKFPEGLDMLPGYSYKFYVGYRYDKLTITANDNFSWDEQDLEVAHLTADEHTYPTTSPEEYSWWKETIKNAIPTHTGGDFEPKFHISTQQQFIEFINLVNGTAATTTTGLNRAKRVFKGKNGDGYEKDSNGYVVNPDHKDNSYDKYYWWYTDVSANKRDTTWVTSAEAAALGYLLYESYHAANGPQPAYSQEEYIRGAYPFYDETRDRHYTVYLDNDLDLFDWNIESIGMEPETPFKGYFEGNMHTISNLNLPKGEEYLFKYIDAAAIRNLRIESTHNVSLVKQGTNTCYIIGIDLRAHSTGNPIAESLTTNQYNNPSYVVGCIHVGDAGGALVGSTGYLYMYGCMQASEGIPAGQGALVGNCLPYSTTNPGYQFLAPQIAFDFNDMNAKLKGTPTWSRFMCNYYDTQLSPRTNAVGTTPDLYSPLEYIRGRESYILKAKNDNLLKGEVTFGALKTVQQRQAYYGLAPWKAMNYGIHEFNDSGIGSTHKCNAHYENNSTGYVHKYPELKAEEPTEEQYDNPLEQKN